MQILEKSEMTRLPETEKKDNHLSGIGPDIDTEFLRDGIASSADEKDKELFFELRKVIIDKLLQGGHDYKPDPFEYRASSIGTCSRKIILEKNIDKFFKPEDFDLLPEWFANGVEQVSMEGSHIPGQIIHEIIQDALQGRILSMEEEITQQIGNAVVKGHYDLLLEYPDGEQIVIDIKSTNAPREALPNKKHLRQLLAYQGILGGIKGALLYVSRNTFRMTYVPQEFDKHEYSDKIVLKVVNLANFEKTETLPPAIPEFPEECGNQYYTCQFYQYCLRDFPNPENSERLSEN